MLGLLSKVVVERISSSYLIVSWSIYGNETVNIVLEYGVITNSSCSNSLQMTVSAYGTTHNISGLHAATAYFVTVVATLDYGGSSDIMMMGENENVTSHNVTINDTTQSSG